MSSVSLTLLLHVLCAVSHVAGGYAEWHKKFPICMGKSQSPINIIAKNSEFDIALTALKFFTGRRQHTTTIVTNNGHSVSFSNLSKSYFVKLKGIYYKFENFHFHWNARNPNGSEHQIDAKYFTSEIHIVHYNTKYHTFEEAASESDGLAVLAVFLQEDSHVKDNTIFSCLRHAIKTVKKQESKRVRCRRFRLDPYRLTPASKEYYSYQGSLTTPPCTQNVQWVVFKEAVSVSHQFMESLRSLVDLHGNSIAPNFRPIQKLNNRHVFRSFHLPASPVTVPVAALTFPPESLSGPDESIPVEKYIPAKTFTVGDHKTAFDRPHDKKYVKPCSG